MHSSPCVYVELPCFASWCHVAVADAAFPRQRACRPRFSQASFRFRVHSLGGQQFSLSFTHQQLFDATPASAPHRSRRLSSTSFSRTSMSSFLCALIIDIPPPRCAHLRFHRRHVRGLMYRLYLLDRPDDAAPGSGSMGHAVINGSSHMCSTELHQDCAC
jgi:hypothetical protein